MKKQVLALITVCFVLFPQTTRKVKLALSGGGARGFAHIGVLKALEEYGFEITEISGTSSGALIGSFYAAGYSVEEIHRIMREFMSQKNIFSDFSRKDIPIERKLNSYTSFFNLGIEKFKFQLPFSLSGDSRLNFVLMKYLAPPSLMCENNFKNLEIPLTVVASDLFKEKAIYFTKGDLSKIVRASISIPTALTVINIDDYYLADGGLYNNLPTNVFSEKDFVIAVNTASEVYANSEEIKSILDVMGHMVNVLSAKSDSASIPFEDIYIQPDLKNYSATDWFSIDSIAIIGYRKTVEILKERGIQPISAKHRKAKKMVNFENFQIGDLRLKGNFRLGKTRIMEDFGVRVDDKFSWEKIKRGINRLFAQNLVTKFWITYKIIDKKIYIFLEIKENIPSHIGLGAFYQNKMGSNINLNFKFNDQLGFSETVEINALIGDYLNGVRIGLRYGSLLKIPLFDYLNFEYKNIEPLRLEDISANFSWFRYEYSTGFQINRNMMLLGSFGYKRATSQIGINSGRNANPEENYANLFLKGEYVFENLDDLYFPTEGNAFSIKYQFTNIKHEEIEKFSEVAETFENSQESYNRFTFDFQSHVSVFEQLFIFSQHYKYSLIINEGRKLVPIFEQNRYDLTRSTYGYFDPALYSYHSIIGTLSLKHKISSSLYLYASYTLAKRWGAIEKVQLKDFDLANMDSGFELGVYMPTFMGPISFTYSKDIFFNGVTRFSIGYLIDE